MLILIVFNNWRFPNNVTIAHIKVHQITTETQVSAVLATINEVITKLCKIVVIL